MNYGLVIGTKNSSYFDIQPSTQRTHGTIMVSAEGFTCEKRARAVQELLINLFNQSHDMIPNPTYTINHQMPIV